MIMCFSEIPLQRRLHLTQNVCQVRAFARLRPPMADVETKLCFGFTLFLAFFDRCGSDGRGKKCKADAQQQGAPAKGMPELVFRR